MDSPEDNLQNPLEKEAGLENKSEKLESPADLIERETEELNSIVNQSIIIEGGLNTGELSAPEQAELSEIKQEESEALEDWKKTSEAVSESKYEATNEGWRQAAEDQFGIKDFDLEQFKRTVLNDQAVSEAFNSGHDWDYIFDNMSYFVEGESYDQASESFSAMGKLEEEMPGSVKSLHEEFGLSSFQRYPKEILLDQLKEPDPKKEVGLLIFADEDWIGSFDNQSKLWKKIYDQQKESLNFRIVECGSGTSLAIQLMKVKQDFENKASLVVLSSHSDPEGFYLSNKNGYVNQKDIVENSSSLKEILAPNAQMIANACSSGAIKGWARVVSKEVGIKAVGPDEPAAIEDIDFAGNDVIPKYCKPDAYSGYNKGFLVSKKKKGK